MTGLAGLVILKGCILLQTVRTTLCILTLATLVLSSGPSIAKQAVTPPITVKGFTYKYYPNARMHMNVCKAKSCKPGSKVSYVLSRAESTPSFARYKSERKIIEAALMARLPKGITATFGKSLRKEFAGFTVYLSPAALRFANGQRRYRASMTIYGKNVWISLISSSTDAKAAKGNGAIFLVGLVPWSKGLKK